MVATIVIEFKESYLVTVSERKIRIVCDSSMIQGIFDQRPTLDTSTTQENAFFTSIDIELNKLRRRSSMVLNWRLPSENYFAFINPDLGKQSIVRVHSTEKVALVKQQLFAASESWFSSSTDLSVKLGIQVTESNTASERYTQDEFCVIIDIDTPISALTNLYLRDYFAQTSLISVSDDYYSSMQAFSTRGDQEFFEKLQHYSNSDQKVDSILKSFSQASLAPQIIYDESSQSSLVQILKFIPST